MESVGFKEWAAVCEALGCGRQSIILRKGGIAEGREGFSFKHREFFLFPTWFHEQPQKVRNELWRGLPSPWSGAGEDSIAKMPMSQDEGIEIKYAAQLDTVRTIVSIETAEALAPLHILRPDVVRERFQYDKAPGLQVALVRLFRVQPGWKFPNEPKYGGCRSWVKLPDVPNRIVMQPVLTDQEHDRLRSQFLAIVEVRQFE